MATASNPDPGQFGSAPGPAPYPPTGQSGQPTDGQYPPPPPNPYGAVPTYPSCPQNPLFVSTPYQPGVGQQSTYVLGSVQPVVTQHYVQVKESYAGHIAFACIVFWFCGWLFGGIAFILAMVASNSSGDGHGKEAKRLGQASMAMSSVGLILGLIAWGVVIWAIVVSVTTTVDYGSGGGGSSCSYTCGGNCYKYRSYSYTSTECYYYFTSCCYSSSGYCYYNY